MTQQPVALLLAEKLEQQFPVGTAQHYLDGEAAAELRRLHSVNAQLLEALETCGEDEWYTDDDYGMVQTYDEDKVRAAIAAAKEMK